MRRQHSNSKDKPETDEAGEYTTIGRGDGWYGHPGEPTSRDPKHGCRRDSGAGPPFDTRRSHRSTKSNESDWYEQDRNTADYAYGSYGRREPGHARSDPYPPAPQSDEQ